MSAGRSHLLGTWWASPLEVDSRSTLGGRVELMSPSSSALNAAEDGTMKISSSVLYSADEDVDESVVVGAGCGQGRDDENVFIGAVCSR